MPVTTLVRVRYAETDQMGIVYYANYFIWFEIGRVELLRSLGLAYSRLEIDHKCILPVIEARCRYRSPARYDDELVIETRPAMLRGTVLKFAYRIYRKANQEEKQRELLAEVVLVPVNARRAGRAGVHRLQIGIVRRVGVAAGVGDAARLEEAPELGDVVGRLETPTAPVIDHLPGTRLAGRAGEVDREERVERLCS